MAVKLEILRDQCIMSGLCVDSAPNTLKEDADGVPVVIHPDGDPDDAILEAAKSCPVGCIVVKNEANQQLWP